MAATILIYGESGTGKTADVGGLALYIWEKTGKKTRLVSTDSGGWQSVQGFVDAGLIEVFSLGGVRSPASAIRKIAKGMWPKVPNAPSPVWQQDLNDVGAIAVDSISGLASLLMREQVTEGRKIGEDIVARFDIEGEVFGNPGRAHYGFIQREVDGLLAAASFLPIERVLFTALEAKGDDQISKQVVYGPATIGKASVDKIPAMVGDLLHYDTATVKEGGKERQIFRAWFQRHPDTLTGVHYPAKPRLQKEVMEKLCAKYPEGYFVRGMKVEEGGIYTYLKVLDELRISPAEEIRAMMARVAASRNPPG